MARNIMLLAVLGSIRNHSEAAEIALHLWYSAFLQPSHVAVLCAIVDDVQQQISRKDRPSLTLYESDGLAADMFQLNLGIRSLLKGAICNLDHIEGENIPYGGHCGAQAHFTDFMDFNSDSKQATQREKDRNDALKAMQKVRYAINRYIVVDQTDRSSIRFNPSRTALHERRSCYLEEPSHRMADLKFRRSGILLPFGASDSDFTVPNKTMFWKDGQWLSKDTADPLGSWK